uniref:Uncharacterized protein n=2 Tax=Glossina morsitans morsitans TaxID=37546 RepID=A0ABK9MFP2_GLOMM
MRRNTNLDSNIILCSAHFALGIISIWALKYVNIKASNSYVNFTITFVYSLFGVLCHTHPYAGKTLHTASAFLNLLVKLIGLVLYTFDVAILTKRYNSFLLLISCALTSLIIIINYFKCESMKLYLNNFFMVWNISIITSIAFRQNEPYWLIGMVALLILNHFILNAILKSIHTTSLHSHEVSVIGLCFFTIFALNSVNEICSS